MEAVHIPTSAFTWSGFRAWVLADDGPERGRIDFLGDSLSVDFGPERYGTRGAVRMAAQCGLYGLVKSGATGYLFGRGIRLSHEAARLSAVPDLMYTSFERFDDGRVTPDRLPDGDMTGLLGSTDMVVEIVSPESARRDIVVLRELYHAAGVSEYWRIDARGEDIVFDLLRYAPDGHQPVPPTTDGWRASAAFAHEFRLTRDRDPVNDWSYTLHARPSPPS